MELINKILSDEQIHIFKNERIKDFIRYLDIYSLFDKWSFNDGADLIDEEKKLLEEFLQNLKAKIPKIGDFSLELIHTFTHNPIYICFYDEVEEKQYNFYDFDSLTRDVVESLIQPYFLSVKEKFIKKYDELV